MRHFKRGFTIIELLTVVAIIGLLISILLPALSNARRQAKDVNASAHLHAIETALEMFQNERGQYPPSDPFSTVPLYSDPVPEGMRLASGKEWFISGMHLLAETLIGQDRLGFDPTGLYDPNVTGQRVGPLLKIGTSGAVGDKDAQNLKIRVSPLAADGGWDLPEVANTPPAPVLDVLRNTGPMVLLDPSYGTPVLYYRANRTGQTSLAWVDTIGYFEFQDNGRVTGDMSQSPKYLGWDLGPGLHHINVPESPSTDPNSLDVFITDPRVGGHRPYNLETFLLISAGDDKTYGTADDIRNWTVPK